MEVEYTNPRRAGAVEITDVPPTGQTVTGYGSGIPTRFMLWYLGVRRRVYMMQYGNSGTPYVKVQGRVVVLDADTQSKLTDS